MLIPSLLSRLRVAALMGAVAAALAMTPGAADAATVSVASGKLASTAAAGETNRVTVGFWGLALQITDTGTKSGGSALPVSPGSGCWALSTVSVACFGAGVTAATGDGADSFDSTAVPFPVTVAGGDGADSISTGGGADSIDGGAGSDKLSSGGGNDKIAARDGTADTVTCGDGSDVATVDAVDVVSQDCEQVVLSDAASPDPTAPADPAGPAPGGDPTGPADPTAPADPGTGPADPAHGTAEPLNVVPPTIPAQTVSVSANGIAKVRVVCPAESGGCRGTVALQALDAAGNARPVAAVARRVAGRRTRKPVTLGRRRFTARAGRSVTVRVRLSKRGRQRILRTRHGHYRIKLTTRSADGKSVVTTQEVTLRPRRTVSRGSKKGRK
jgi:hypothetical protein